MEWWAWVLFFAFVTVIALWIRSRDIKNARTCGHTGRVMRYVPEERAWLCTECYTEWFIDHGRR